MYEAYFAFNRNPFHLNPDPSFLFLSKEHSRARAYLRFGLQQAEGFIVLTGGIGTGKTTLVRELLQEIDSKRVVAAQLVSTQLDADDLLRAVAIAFGLPVSNTCKAVLLAQFQAFAASLLAQGQRALLLVDEAQNLTPRAMEELRMLSNFQAGRHALLQSFLIGQSELCGALRRPDMQQFRQRVIAAHHLGPLEEEETRAYMEFRLRVVGWRGDPAFDPDAFAAVHRATEGIPRRINLLGGRVLLGAYLNQCHWIDTAYIESVVAEMAEEQEGGFPGIPAAAVPLRAANGNGNDHARQPSRGSQPEVAPAVWKRRAELHASDGPTATAAEGVSAPIRPMILLSVAARLDRIDRRLHALFDAVRDIGAAAER